MARVTLSPTTLSRTTFLATLALAAGAALAADPAGGGGHEALSPMPSAEQGAVTGLTAIIVFIIVLGVLAWKVWPAITRGLDDRSQKIRAEIEAAEQARAQAKSALQQYEQSLSEARAEAQKMLERAKVEQQAYAADLRAKAEVELTALKDRARRDIESAKRTALAEIYTEAANLATMAAGKILRREINAGDQQRLVDESMGELQAMRG